MTFSEKMKELLKEGALFTKEMVGKASAKAQDLSEIGVLKFEIRQAEAKAQKSMASLGTEVYAAFEENGQESVTRDQAEIQGLMEEITRLRALIEDKQKDLEAYSAK